jgi:hypothetical protein
MTTHGSSGSHDSRISSNRRPSLFSNFFTALDAAILS